MGTHEAGAAEINPWAVIAISGGIVTLLTFLMMPLLGFSGGLLSVFFGVRGLREIKQTGQRGRALAISGIALGSAGVLGVVTLFVRFAAFPG